NTSEQLTLFKIGTLPSSSEEKTQEVDLLNVKNEQNMTFDNLQYTDESSDSGEGGFRTDTHSITPDGGEQMLSMNVCVNDEPSLPPINPMPSCDTSSDEDAFPRVPMLPSVNTSFANFVSFPSLFGPENMHFGMNQPMFDVDINQMMDVDSQLKEIIEQGNESKFEEIMKWKYNWWAVMGGQCNGFDGTYWHMIGYYQRLGIYKHLEKMYSAREVCIEFLRNDSQREGKSPFQMACSTSGENLTYHVLTQLFDSNNHFTYYHQHQDFKEKDSIADMCPLFETAVIQFVQIAIIAEH
ncbi:hypothetical protein RFI_19828, partial [Reticulomyxa filosa]